MRFQTFQTFQKLKIKSKFQIKNLQFKYLAKQLILNYKSLILIN